MPSGLQPALDTAKDLGFVAALGLAIGADLIADIATLGLSDSPMSFALTKAKINAATHVGLDVLGAAAQRVRNLRPSATTLAV